MSVVRICVCVYYNERVMQFLFDLLFLSGFLNNT